MIPYGKQFIDEDDIIAVRDVLRSDFLTTGPKIVEFEQALADYCGAKHAVVVSSGTAALHVAMLAADIGLGDYVLTSPNTFLSSANCAEMVGAAVDFSDIDSDTLCVSLETLQSAWNNDVKAVVPVDFAGYPCVSKEMADYIHERGAIVIEDAAHAIGSSRDGYRVGGFPWVDMTTFSFHPVKTITSGEGGAIMTNNDRLADRCRLLRNHGMQKRKVEDENLKLERMIDRREQGAEYLKNSQIHPSDAPWYYEMKEVGYNYRMTDFQAALGLSQLKKLDQFIKRRQAIVDQYNEAFCTLHHAKCPFVNEWDSISRTQDHNGTLYPSIDSAWHLYVLQFDFDAIGKSRSHVMSELKEMGVGTQVHYIPVHTQPYYVNKYGYGRGKCPNAEAFYERCLSLPLFPAMSDEDVVTVIRAVRGVVG